MVPVRRPPGEHGKEVVFSRRDWRQKDAFFSYLFKEIDLLP